MSRRAGIRVAIRAGIVVVAFAGLLAMHGITVHHSDPAAAAAGSSASPGASGAHAGGMTVDDTVPDTVRAADDDGFAAASGHQHDLGAVCLAILTISLALLLLLRQLAARRQERRPAVGRSYDPGVPTASRAGPALAPSLSELCVLRT